MIKAVTLRQLCYLTESVRTGTTVGLKELYGFDGALGELPELREPWAKPMNTVTAHVDPWFFSQAGIPAGSRVLDLAGNTGLGAVNTLRLSGASGLKVTTFDLPGTEPAAGPVILPAAAPSETPPKPPPKPSPVTRATR
ncbi:hypothetical protein O7599_00180 [Streptomyces sp. WMMC500]|uniref:hypothetical protein n=1 Tax=Streptomyces sp. WMMC500 TaxID=3015154 RepID=UPI00248C08FB|nr:hypothetical protein [Streptomyces sp. WMMC500]WBB61015.1 hypothetical protein O7599_00180 [Streptomyces sp. WMMC500]